MAVISYGEFNQRVREYITTLAELHNAKADLDAILNGDNDPNNPQDEQLEIISARINVAIQAESEFDRQLLNANDTMPDYDDKEPDVILKNAGIFYRKLQAALINQPMKILNMASQRKLPFDKILELCHNEAIRLKQPLEEFGLCTNPEEALQITLRYKGA